MDPNLVQTVPRSQFEPAEKLAVGNRFEADTDTGPQVVHIAALRGDGIVVDANEPYAGQTVRFQVKVLAVREASRN